MVYFLPRGSRPCSSCRIKGPAATAASQVWAAATICLRLPERYPLTPAVRHACRARCPSANSSNDIIASPPPPNCCSQLHPRSHRRPNQPLGRLSLTPAPSPHATSSTSLHRSPKHSTAAREMPDSQPEAAPVFVLALYSQHVGPPTAASCVSPLLLALSPPTASCASTALPKLRTR